MSKFLHFENISPNAHSATLLPGLTPRMVDSDYLSALGVSVAPSADTLAGLMRGSRLFRERLANGKLVPRPVVELAEVDVNSDFEVHNYTGHCPVTTYEINPVTGCNVGCLYCLVTDGVHEQELKAYTNYHLLVRRFLEAKQGQHLYFYFSPKTEALQEPTLVTGIAHNILRAFVAHFKRHPESQAHLFFVSKGGSKQLQVKHDGESILDLFEQLGHHMQFAPGLSIMPAYLRDALEPFAAPMAERLEAVRMCQERGVMADSAVVQPNILPYMTDEVLHDFFGTLKAFHMINYKPEFLTLCMENLAMIGQLAGYHDKDMERTLYEYYIAPENRDHKKQRGRTAPNRASSRQYLERMMAIAEQYGISTSICFWVRVQLKISNEMIPLVNKNGFQCLGYQTRLFDEPASHW